MLGVARVRDWGFAFLEHLEDSVWRFRGSWFLEGLSVLAVSIVRVITTLEVGGDWLVHNVNLLYYKWLSGSLI